MSNIGVLPVVALVMIFLGFVASIISISTQVWANMTVESSGKRKTYISF